MFNHVFVTFPYNVFGQVWYLIVSFPLPPFYVGPIFSVCSQFDLEVDKYLVIHAYCNHLAIFSSIFVALTINKIYNVIDRAITVLYMVWLLFACIITTPMLSVNVRRVAKIRNRYNQVPHLTQDTTWEVTKTQLNITNKSQEVSSFPAGDRKAKVLNTNKY